MEERSKRNQRYNYYINNRTQIFEEHGFKSQREYEEYLRQKLLKSRKRGFFSFFKRKPKDK